MTISQPAQTWGRKGCLEQGFSPHPLLLSTSLVIQHLLLGCSFGFPYHVINLYHKCDPLSLVNGIVEQLPSIHTVLSHNLQLVPHHHSNFKSNLRIPWIRSQFLCKTKQQNITGRSYIINPTTVQTLDAVRRKKTSRKVNNFVTKIYPTSQDNCVYFK